MPGFNSDVGSGGFGPTGPTGSGAPGGQGVTGPTGPLGTGPTGIGALLVYVAATDPGPTNDGTQGYSVGSAGLNSASGVSFVCRDNTTGAAVWDRRIQQQAPRVAGNWYWPDNITAWQSSLSLTSNFAQLIPIMFEERLTLDQLAVGIVSNPTGGTGSCAVYASSATGPTGPALGTTTWSYSATGMVAGTLTPNVQVEPGVVYWLGATVSIGAGTQPSVVCSNPTSMVPPLLTRVGTPTLANLGAGNNSITGNVVGKLLVANMVPPAWGTMGLTGSMSAGSHPFIAFHVGSIP